MSRPGPDPSRGSGPGFFSARRLAVLAGILAVLLGAVAGLVILVQSKLAFPAPPPEAQQAGTLAAAGGESIWLDAAGSQVEAWYLPAESDGPAPLVLYAHGNGELIDFWAEPMAPLRAAGIGVLLVEYPGYGRSGGRPSQQSITSAMVAAYDWAVRQPRVDPRRIVGYGRSMGGGAVAQIAAKRTLAALILESTYTSLEDMVHAHGVPRFLIVNRLDTREVLRSFMGPVLIVHGRHDVNIPASHADGLAAAAPQARLEWLDCGHNDCPLHWELLLSFLAENGVSNSPSIGGSP
jgi:uncharacterized protein